MSPFISAQFQICGLRKWVYALLLSAMLTKQRKDNILYHFSSLPRSSNVLEHTIKEIHFLFPFLSLVFSIPFPFSSLPLTTTKQSVILYFSWSTQNIYWFGQDFSMKQTPLKIVPPPPPPKITTNYLIYKLLIWWVVGLDENQ